MEKQKNRKVLTNLIWSIKTLCKFKPSYLIFMIVESIIKGATPVITLIITQQMINKIQLRTGSFREVAFLLAALIIVGLLNEIFINVTQLKINNYEIEFGTYMQSSILHKVSELDCKDFENSHTYDLISRAQYDADMGVIGNIKSLFLLVSLAITTLSYMIIIIKYNFIIFAVIILIPIVRYYFEKKYNLIEYDVIKRNTEKERQTSYLSFLLTNAEHFKEIKMYGLFDFFIDKYKKIKYGCNRDLIKVNNKRTVIFNILGTAEMVIDFFVILNIIAQAFVGNILIGEFILYNNSINSLKQNLISIFSCLSVMYKNNAVVEQVKAFFELTPEKNSIEGLTINEIKNVRLENVSYKYRGSPRYTLTNISITLEPGEFVVLMGYNGSGKSTLIKILMGIYNDYEGEIYINNINRRTLNLTSYRKLIGVLFQDYIKYETSIPENVWYGNPESKDKYDEIAKILEKVNLDEDANTSNNTLGYQFNKGRQLSIGQWQKLALARTLIKDGDMYIFDEPNASLDLVSENVIFNSIYSETQNKIAIIIMHRFNNVIKKADKIIVLEKGILRETGSHEELLCRDGIYSELYSIQHDVESEH